MRNTFGTKTKNRIDFWLCKNCNKEYNSKTAIKKELAHELEEKGYGMLFGFKEILFLCPHCKTEHYDRRTNTTNAKWLRVEDE